MNYGGNVFGGATAGAGGGYQGGAKREGGYQGRQQQQQQQGGGGYQGQQQQQQGQTNGGSEVDTNMIPAAETVITLSVPNELMGNIFGKQGATLREIISLSGARVSVSGRGEFMEGMYV
jgi:transcription initiation factor TFIID subunit TAF12